MSVSVKDLKTYTSFARRFAGKFVRDRVEERRTPMLPAPHRPEPSTWSNERLTVAWLGHATVLINFYGTWLLTDPALRSRVGVRVGAVTLGPRRLVRPALGIKELPALDAVLVSHAHMDHCDMGTLKRLPRRTRAVVQEGYGGFLVEKNGRALVFGGDTAYTDAFSRLKARGTRVDLSILPIGAYDPYVYVHANPEQAWQMRREMGAEYILPMHHSTFRLSREPVDEPRRRILAAAGEEQWRVALTEIGETWVLPE